MIRIKNPKLFSYPKSKKPFNKENLREWVLENWTLFEEEDGEISADIFEAMYKAFGKKIPMHGKLMIEQNQWVDEIFSELDDIRKSTDYFDLRTGKWVRGKKKNPSKAKKPSKKVTKKKAKIKKTTTRKRNPDKYKEKLKKAEEELKKAKFALQNDNSQVGSTLSRSLYNKYVHAKERYDDLMYSDD